MKGFKKLAAIGAAGFLAVSAGIFAGCNGSDDGGYEFSAEAEMLVKALDESPDYLGFDMALKSTEKYKSTETYHNDSSQDRSYEESDVHEVNARGKFNVKSGNGDVVIHESHRDDERYSGEWDYLFLRNYKMFKTHKYYENEADDAEITDFGDCVLDRETDTDGWIYWVFKAAGIDTDSLLSKEKSTLSGAAAFSAAYDYDSPGAGDSPAPPSGGDAPDNPSTVTISPVAILYYLVLNDVTLSDVNVLLIALADAAGAVSVNGNAVTLDINKLAYRLAQDAKTVLDSVDEYTTVSALCQNDIVKKWIKAFTAFIDFDDVRKTVEEELQPLLKDKLDYSLPAADEKDDVYSYLMKLIDDTAFATKVLDIPTALGALSVEGLLDMLGDNLNINAVKEYVNQYTKDITPTVFEFTSSDSWDYAGYYKEHTEERRTVTASGAKIVYTLSDNQVTKMEVTCESIAHKRYWQRETSYGESGESLLPYVTSVTESDDKFEFRLTVDYAAQAYSLANIDDCFVYGERRVFVDGREQTIWIPTNEPDDYGYDYIRLFVTLKASNGEATGFIIEDENDNSATLSGLNGGTVTLGDETYTFSVRESSNYLSLIINGIYDRYGDERGASFYKEWITTATETVKDFIR